MFTSRAEYRLSLREDNADLRLTEVGRRLGLVDDARWDAFNRKREAIDAEIQRLRSVWVNPRVVEAHTAQALLGQTMDKDATAYELLKRPQVGYSALMEAQSLSGGLLVGPGVDDPKVAEQVEIQVKYQGYIKKQKEDVERQLAQESVVIPEDFDYDRVP